MKLFLFIYSLIITIYYLYTIYLLPYYLSIYQYFTKVVSCYFLCFCLLPYYFFSQNHAAQVFLCRFYRFFGQKSKKICQFFAIFSRCVSTS